MERNVADVIIKELTQLPPFNNGGWQFNVCSDAKQLLKASMFDVLLLSRFLSGMDEYKLLSEIKVRFKSIHVVILVGTVNERAKAYMKKARSLGFNNFVTKDIFGEPPYVLPVAILKTYDELINEKKTIQQESIDKDQDTLGKTSQGNNNDIQDNVLSEIANKQLKKSLPIAITYGNFFVSEKLAITNCKNLKELKNCLNKADVILLGDNIRDITPVIKMIQKSKNLAPILVVGTYKYEHIMAGATGYIETIDGVWDYIN